MATLVQPIRAELEHESGSLRKILERLPEGELAWQPHPKSMALGRLAAHAVNLVGWAGVVVETEESSTVPGEVAPEAAGEALRAGFEDHLGRSLRALEDVPDARLLAPWRFLRPDGEVYFELRRIQALRSFVLNHLYHHRGQLTVYLRLLDVPVPPVYGPTADES